MRWMWFAIVAIVLFANFSQAFWYEGPKKFTFLPLQSYSRFNDLSTKTCNATLTDFVHKWDTHAPVPKIKAACAYHQECILTNLDEGSKAYMSTASLVLGFVPILLSTAGPTLSEIGLLSLERPALAGLISLGTAAVYPSRVLGHEDDSCRRLLKRRYRMGSGIVRFLSQPRYKYLVSALEYVLVAAAITNILEASWELGVGSVVTFRCTISLLPLVWVLAPALIHLFTSAAFILHRRRQRGPRATKGLKKLLLVELSPCIAHDPLPPGTVQLNTFVMIFHGFSALLGFLHVMFGILIFSSLLFTMILDAAAIIFRYFASVLVCRTILIIELEGLRYVHQQKPNKTLLRTAGTFASFGDKDPPRTSPDLERMDHRGGSEHTLIGTATTEPNRAYRQNTSSVKVIPPSLEAQMAVNSRLPNTSYLSFEPSSPHHTHRSPNSSLDAGLPSDPARGSIFFHSQLPAQYRPRPSLGYQPPSFRPLSTVDSLSSGARPALTPTPPPSRGRTGSDASFMVSSDGGGSSSGASSTVGGSTTSTRSASRSPSRGHGHS
jgi:hypothetical protein